MDGKSNGGTAPETTVARKVKPIWLEVTDMNGKTKKRPLHYHEDGELTCVQARNNGTLGFIGGDENKPIKVRVLEHLPDMTQCVTVNVDGFDEDVRVFVFRCKHCAYHRDHFALHFVPSTDRLTKKLMTNTGTF